MADLFASGRVVVGILLLMLVEFATLLLMPHRSRARVPATHLLVALAAGAALMLALRAALIGSPWPWIAFWLAVALAMHLADLTLRWRAPPSSD